MPDSLPIGSCAFTLKNEQKGAAGLGFNFGGYPANFGVFLIDLPAHILKDFGIHKQFLREV